MKRFFQLVSMACLCMCFASCNDEALVETSQPEATGQSFRLIAKQQSPSRLALGEDGMTLYWEAGDKLHLVDKNNRSKHYELLADLDDGERATEASFSSQERVPAGNYFVVNNYNQDLVYDHVPLKTVEEINTDKDLTVWGELKIEASDTSAEVALQHIYAKLRVVLKNTPAPVGPNGPIYDMLNIGIYAAGKTGFPYLNQITQNGLMDVNEDFTEYDKYHNLRLNPNDPIYLDNQEDMEYTALVLPTNTTGDKLYFYILQGPKCYEFEKNGVNFEAGKRYVVTLDMSDNGGATISEFKYSNVIELSTVQDCRHAAYMTGASHLSFEPTYILKENIDFSEDVFLPIYAETFLGNNKKISNITLNWPNDDNVGLFRYEPERQSDKRNHITSVYNLTLENVSIKGHSYVGALGGLNITGDDCKIIGTSNIQGSGDCVGGVVGMNNVKTDKLSNMSISDKTSISGINNVGGIIGTYDVSNNSYYSRTESFKLIESCVSSASVMASGNYAGGIAGKINNSSLSECVNYGQVRGSECVGGIVGSFAVYPDYARVLIEKSANEGKVSGTNCVGGIAGYNDASFSTCYSINEISASGSGVGGITGHAGEHSQINDCYSLATISVGENGHAGGILGCQNHEYSSANISRCYFAGTMPETKQYGIVGYVLSNCKVNSCLTTMPNLVGVLNDGVVLDDVLDDASEANVVSILDKRDIINAGNAYSKEYWSLDDYPAYCIKFSAGGFSGNITIPGFSDEEIVI